MHRNVDVRRMIWGWDETTKQDKVITENNQAGIYVEALSARPLFGA